MRRCAMVVLLRVAHVDVRQTASFVVRRTLQYFFRSYQRLVESIRTRNEQELQDTHSVAKHARFPS